MRRESEDAGFNRKLVREVKKYPCLYNFNVSDYSRRDSTYAAWESIASELNDSVFNCKDAWRNLRIVFTRHMKKQAAGLCKKKYYLLDDLRFLIPFLNPRKTIFPINELTSGIENESLHNDTVTDLVDSTRDILTVYEDAIDESNTIKKRKIAQNETDSTNISDSTRIKPNENALTYQEDEQPLIKKKRCIQSDDETNFITCDRSERNQLSEKNCKKMFLLSLFPDLEEMNHSQFRRFRSRVVELIDNVLVVKQAESSNNVQDSVNNEIKIEFFEDGP